MNRLFLRSSIPSLAAFLLGGLANVCQAAAPSFFAQPARCRLADPRITGLNRRVSRRRPEQRTNAS